MRRHLFAVRPMPGRMVPAGTPAAVASHASVFRLMSTILRRSMRVSPALPMAQTTMLLPIAAGAQLRFCAADETPAAEADSAGAAGHGLVDIDIAAPPNQPAARSQSARTAIVTSFDAAARTVTLQLRYRSDIVSHTVQLPPEGAEMPVSVADMEAIFVPQARIRVTGRVFKHNDENVAVVSKLHVPPQSGPTVELVIVSTRAATESRGMVAYAVEKAAPADGSPRPVFFAAVERALNNEVEAPESQLQPGVTISGRVAAIPANSKRKMRDVFTWSISDPTPSVEVTPDMIAAVDAVKPKPRSSSTDEPPREYPAELLVIEKPQPGLDRQRFAHYRGSLVVLRDCTLPAGTFVRAKLSRTASGGKSKAAAAAAPVKAVEWTASEVEEVPEPPRVRGTVVAIRKNSARVFLDDATETDASGKKTVGVVMSITRGRTDTQCPSVGLSRDDLRDKLKPGARVEGVILAPNFGSELRSVRLLDKEESSSTEHPAVASLLADGAEHSSSVGDWRIGYVAEAVRSGHLLIRFATPPHDGSGHLAIMYRENVLHAPRIGDVVEVLMRGSNQQQQQQQQAESGKRRPEHTAAVLPGTPQATESGLRGTMVGTAQMGKLHFVKIELSDGRVAYKPLNPSHKHMTKSSSSSMCNISIIGDFGPDKALLVTNAQRGICRDVPARINNVIRDKVAYMRLHPTAEQSAESGVMPGQTAYVAGPAVNDCEKGAWVTVTVDTTPPGACDYAARRPRPMAAAPADAPTEEPPAEHPNKRTSSSKRSGSSHPDRRSASAARDGEETFATRGASKAANTTANTADGALPSGYLPVEFGLSGTVVTDTVLGSYAVRPDGFDEPIAVDTAHTSAATLDLVRPGARLTFDMAVHSDRPDCVALNVRRATKQ